jgi:hypothetical protein
MFHMIVLSLNSERWKITAFWDQTWYSLVDSYHHFEGAYCLRLQGCSWMKQVPPVPIYKATYITSQKTVILLLTAMRPQISYRH